MKYDVETFEGELLVLVQDKLPLKIAEIDAEKADGILLDVPLSNEYFNTTDDEVINTRMAVLYGIIDGDAVPIPSITAEDNRYAFLVYLNEINIAPGTVRKKLLRYIRALKEIFQENSSFFPCVSKMIIQSVAPTQIGWDENETSPTYKVGGVYIQASIVG